MYYMRSTIIMRNRQKSSFVDLIHYQKQYAPGDAKELQTSGETLSLIWLNGQESDLSMLCEFTFKGETIIAAVLEEVHVF